MGVRLEYNVKLLEADHRYLQKEINEHTEKLASEGWTLFSIVRLYGRDGVLVTMERETQRETQQ